MITYSNGQIIMLKDFCGKCKQKIIPNGLEPILFNSDYYHFNCCTWDKKTIESNDNNLKTKEEIQAWIIKTKAEITLKNQADKL